MRIVQKFQDAGKVNKPTRIVVGHPELTLLNPRDTYSLLDKEYNMYPTEGENTGIRYNPYDPYISIDRDIIPAEDGYAPADTIYTKLIRGLDNEGKSRQTISSQAGVVHRKNYKDQYAWPYNDYSRPSIAPIITNGNIIYYDPYTKQFQPAYKNQYNK